MRKEDHLLEHINEKRYFFRRTCFILDPDILVEMVAIAKETKKIDDTAYYISCDVLASNSREIKLEDCNEHNQEYLRKLANQDSIEEVYEFKGENEAKKIIETYKGGDLFKFKISP